MKRLAGAMIVALLTMSSGSSAEPILNGSPVFISGLVLDGDIANEIHGHGRAPRGTVVYLASILI